MLDSLIESSSHTKENKRRGGFLISTLLVVTTIFLSGILWSLFAKDLQMGAGDFELSRLVAPIKMVEDEPPPPLPKIEKLQQSPKPATETTRQANIARIEESQFVPTEISVVPNTQQSRPVGRFLIKDGIETDAGTPSGKFNAERTGGVGISDINSTSAIENEKTEIPPPPQLKKEPIKPAVEMRRSLGVVNGIAVNLVKPPYPPAAKIVRASGAVNVQVTIDEKGNVVTANAVSGHPLLRQASEAAARASKFNPTLLSNQPVKVTGVIVYKFANQ